MTTKSKKVDVYKMVTDQMIELVTEMIAKVEAGEPLPYSKPWVQADRAKNFKSGKFYRGLNAVVLPLVAANKGYKSQYWLTFKQAKDKGGMVRKGEKSTIVTFWKWIKITDKDDNEVKRVPFLRYFRVFNAEQIDWPEGFEIPKNESLPDNFSPIEAAENMIANMPNRPTIEHKESRAYYAPIRDIVNMPTKESFHTPHGYYATLFHELGHATGHATRTGRIKPDHDHKFGSQDYSEEELVAELTASMLCNITGIQENTVENSAAYLTSWLRAFQNDPKMLVSAAGKAQKAADYIQGITWGNEQPKTKAETTTETKQDDSNEAGEPAPAVVETVKPEVKTEKIKAVKFEIFGSESAVVPGDGVTFDNWQDAHDFMQKIALAQGIEQYKERQEIKVSSWYDKTNFRITYADGETYKGRADVHAHHETGDRDLGTHIADYCDFYAGKLKPDHMTESEYAPFCPGGKLHQPDMVTFRENYELVKIAPRPFTIEELEGNAGDDTPAKPEKPELVPLKWAPKSTRIGATTHAVMTKRKAKLNKVETLAWAASKDKARQTLQHTHIHTDGAEVATDGFRIHRIKNVHAAGATCMICEAENLTFPDYTQIYKYAIDDKKLTQKITVDADQFRMALAIATVYTKHYDTTNADVKQRVVLRFEDDRMTIYSGDTDLGCSQTTIATKFYEYKNGKGKIGMVSANGLFLIDALDHVAPNGGTVTLKIVAQNSPMLLESGTDRDALIMPMQTTDENTVFIRQAEKQAEAMDVTAEFSKISTMPRTVNVGKHTGGTETSAGYPVCKSTGKTETKPAEGAVEIIIDDVTNRVHKVENDTDTAEIVMVGSVAA